MNSTAKTILFVAFAMECLGVWFSAYGVVRESFVELSRETRGFAIDPDGIDPEGFHPDAFDMARSNRETYPVDRLLTTMGLRLGLLPSDSQLTSEHRRENARSAVIGILLLLGGLLLEGLVKARRPLRRLAGGIFAAVRMAAGALQSAGSWLRRTFRRS